MYRTSEKKIQILLKPKTAILLYMRFPKKKKFSENTIAAICTNPETFPPDRLHRIISKPDKTRQWFTPHFYRCLPLTIANQQGFVIKTEYDFEFMWNGGDNPEDISISTFADTALMLPNISSHFGSGILTVSIPYILKTPPGINLMTITPPNVVIPNITHMSGIIETDNLKYTFTFNLKIQIPNIPVRISAGTPIAAFMPIKRYFDDEFKLVNAETVLDQEQISNYLTTYKDGLVARENTFINRFYFNGKDVYGNEFDDHQKRRSI